MDTATRRPDYKAPRGIRRKRPALALRDRQCRGFLPTKVIPASARRRQKRAVHSIYLWSGQKFGERHLDSFCADSSRHVTQMEHRDSECLPDALKFRLPTISEKDNSSRAGPIQFWAQ